MQTVYARGSKLMGKVSIQTRGKALFPHILSFFPPSFSSARNDQGQTPLYWACESDDPYLAQVLIDNGADVDATESFGYSPLHLAAFLGHENLTRTLINANASLTGGNNEGSTPLHLAAKQGHASVVRLIVASGKADVLAKDHEGQTPIQLCEKDSETFNILRDCLLELKRQRDSSMQAEAAAAAAAPAVVAPAADAEEVTQLKEQMDKMSRAVALLTSNIEVERGRVAELENKLAEEMFRSNDLLKKGGLSLCVKCQSRVRDTVFMPCMHFHFCGQCTKGMSSCESCNVPVTGKIPAILE